MTRILYWNINNFSLPKIHSEDPAPKPAEAEARRNFIVGIMAGPSGGTPPDIIIVVEVYSRVREVGLEGTVLDPNRASGKGVLQLLDRLRAKLGTQWCVVPPLNLGANGMREAVAVFYNSTNLQFTGPNVYYDRYPDDPTSQIGQGQPVNADTYGYRTNYPLPWKKALPVDLARTTNFTINGKATPINEWQLAGQWEYYTGVRPIPSPVTPPKNRIDFPNQSCRGPFWTRFKDLSFMGDNKRSLNLFTVHTSPATARAAVRAMQQATEMTAVADGEVNVILGDFNVDSFSGSADAYNWMAASQGAIYTMQLDPRKNHAGDVVAARKPYCMTHLLPVGTAMPFNTVGVTADPQHNVYPRYGYMGSTFPKLNDSGAIDNFFTAYGKNAGGPASNITVVNRIVGTPYNKLTAPDGVTAELTNGLKYLTALKNTIPVSAPNGGIDPPDDTIDFSNWQNFGGHYSTSDHLPLMIDI
jgi:hypothetical protein